MASAQLTRCTGTGSTSMPAALHSRSAALQEPLARRNQGDHWLELSNILPPIYCVRFVE
jgi:hypothetical protein